MLRIAIAVISLILTGGLLGVALLRYYQENIKPPETDLKVEKRENKENILSSIGEEMANLHFYYKVTNEGTGDGILLGVRGELVGIEGEDDENGGDGTAESVNSYFSYSTFGSPLEPEEHVAEGETHRMKAHCGISDPDIVDEYDSASFEITWMFEGPGSTYTETFEEDVIFDGPKGKSRQIHKR